MNLVNSVFDMRETGKRISNCRKQKNLTQLEMADKLNVSYQAVSSWERGETMPDISKLPNLSQILGVSIDYILNDSEQAQIVEMIISGNISEVAKNKNISIVDVINTAPLLKPSQLSELLKDDFNLNSVEELIGIAPFISMEDLDKLAGNIGKINSVEELIGIAPFASIEVLGKLAGKIDKINSVEELIGIAPFVSKEIYSRLEEKHKNLEFIQEETGMETYLDYGLFFDNGKEAYCYKNKIIGFFIDEQGQGIRLLNSKGEIHVKVNRDNVKKIIEIVELSSAEYAKVSMDFTKIKEDIERLKTDLNQEYSKVTKDVEALRMELNQQKQEINTP